ncbi:MAG: nucleotide exchange factor GrpE, partial [Candidatus Thorarchaeota archaeon]
QIEHCITGEKLSMKDSNDSNKTEIEVNEEPTQDVVQDSIDISKTEKIMTELENNPKIKKLLEQLDKETNVFNLKELIESNEILLQKIEATQKEKNEYLDLLQRFKADFENYKKRAQKQEESNIRFYSENILSKIFEPIEDIHRAIVFAKDNKQNTIPLEGITIIYEKLSRIMEDEGVAFIDPKPGEDFDPQYHEAVCLDESGNNKANSVVQNFEKGYRIKNRVIRAARVMIAAESSQKNNNNEKEN